ncbi:MarR family winged helix-turn-helix transcriptional regulator [Bosea sp. TWI1241]|uniref:MarR family winged helix-turn-helix transcriptional regulator n=1 Tax=Bosea sp. TWI1241 TaxID=3148904 RepID=UPI003209BC0C
MSKSPESGTQRPVPFATTLHVRDHCLCLHLQRAARSVARLFDEALRPFALTNQQFSLLMSLNRPEPPPIGPVAQLLGMDRTTLTAALKPLERRGLVLVETDPADRRSRRLVLTAQGQALLAAALPSWAGSHAGLDERLEGHGGPGELRAALNALSAPAATA